jgi:hypothetical protein
MPAAPTPASVDGGMMAAAAAYLGLVAPVGFAMLLGVVGVDMLIDFCPELGGWLLGMNSK